MSLVSKWMYSIVSRWENYSLFLFEINAEKSRTGYDAREMVWKHFNLAYFIDNNIDLYRELEEECFKPANSQ